MWTTLRHSIENGGGEIFRVVTRCGPVTLGEVLTGWELDAKSRAFCIAELAATPYSGFFWELPQVTPAGLSRPFECALMQCDQLARMKADDRDFAEHLKAADGVVAAFRNLGHDALLIAPRRVSDADCYGHIAAFVRKAPEAQQHALLHCIAMETKNLLNAGHRFWISTSGLGVPWLHVRLDTDPKYYQYRPYAEPQP